MYIKNFCDFLTPERQDVSKTDFLKTRHNLPGDAGFLENVVQMVSGATALDSCVVRFVSAAGIRFDPVRWSVWVETAFDRIENTCGLLEAVSGRDEVVEVDEVELVVPRLSVVVGDCGRVENLRVLQRRTRS